MPAALCFEAAGGTVRMEAAQMMARVGGWMAVADPGGAAAPAWQAVRIALAAAMILGILLLLAAALRRLWPRKPAGLLGPLAVGVLIAAETVFLNLLSLAGWVTAPAILIGHVVAAAGLAVWLRAPAAALRRLAGQGVRTFRRERALWLIAPLAILLFAAAWIYPPTTYDAMTYHMGRVAHWIQNKSIAFYPTAVDRQNWMAPGSEYLILVVQSVAGSDRWANSVQWLSWVLCLGAVPALCRLGGVPRGLAPWAAVLMAGLPMGVLQACSTQTDLVAALMVLAVAAACLPLLHPVHRWRFRDVLLLATMLASAILVKPTAVLASSPLLLYVIGRALKQPSVLRACAGFLVRAALAALLILACVAGPHAARATSFLGKPEAAELPANPRFWSYGAWGEWNERLLNPLLSTYAHHSLGRDAVAQGLRNTGIPWARKQGDILARDTTWVWHEDFAGNPFHFLLGAAAGVWLLARGRILKPLPFWFGLAPFIAWVVFHLFIRNQIWLSRLQTSLFFLSPLCWSAAAAAGQPRQNLRRVLLLGMSLLCLGMGYNVALHMGRKPLLPAPAAATRDELYYLYHPAGAVLKAEHDKVLDHMAATGATRLGLVLGADSYDYPLTWRAMQRGFQVRHCSPRSPWPEAFYITQ